MRFRHTPARAALAAILVAAAPAALAQYVSLVGGTPPVQSFDTLAASGTGSTLPDGWYFTETGSNANTTYVADDGTLNSGNTYSYGAAGSLHHGRIRMVCGIGGLFDGLHFGD